MFVLTFGASQIVKIHPGSVLCDKKVPAIVYDELVRSPLGAFPLFLTVL
jgi:hypothetical protein